MLFELPPSPWQALDLRTWKRAMTQMLMMLGTLMRTLPLPLLPIA